MSLINKTRSQLHNAVEIDRLTSDIQEDLLDSIHKQLLVDDINFTGDLSSSFKKTTTSEGFKALETDNKYANFVDRGMPPGQHVDWVRLFIWVQEKMGINDEEEARIITFKVRNKIVSQGIPSTRFVKKAIKYLIGKHGAIKIKSESKKVDKLSRALSKVMKWVRKTKKIARKVERITHKTIGQTKPTSTGGAKRGRYYG